jgi:hypothetical protein
MDAGLRMRGSVCSEVDFRVCCAFPFSDERFQWKYGPNGLMGWLGILGFVERAMTTSEHKNSIYFFGKNIILEASKLVEVLVVVFFSGSMEMIY